MVASNFRGRGRLGGFWGKMVVLMVLAMVSSSFGQWVGTWRPLHATQLGIGNQGSPNPGDNFIKIDTLGGDFDRPFIDPLLNQHIFYARTDFYVAGDGRSNRHFRSPTSGRIGAANVFRTSQRVDFRNVDNHTDPLNRTYGGTYLQNIQTPNANIQVIAAGTAPLLWYGSASTAIPTPEARRQATGDLAGDVYTHNTVNIPEALRRLPRFPDVRAFDNPGSTQSQTIWYANRRSNPAVAPGAMTRSTTTGAVGTTAANPFRPGSYSNINITTTGIASAVYMEAGTYFIEGDININTGCFLFVVPQIGGGGQSAMRTVIYVGGNVTLGHINANAHAPNAAAGLTSLGGVFAPNPGSTMNTTTGAWTNSPATASNAVAGVNRIVSGLSGLSNLYVFLLDQQNPALGQIVFVMTGNEKTALLGVNGGMAGSVINPRGRVVVGYRGGSSVPLGTGQVSGEMLQFGLYGQVFTDYLELMNYDGHITDYVPGQIFFSSSTNLTVGGNPIHVDSNYTRTIREGGTGVTVGNHSVERIGIRLDSIPGGRVVGGVSTGYRQSATRGFNLTYTITSRNGIIGIVRDQDLIGADYINVTVLANITNVHRHEYALRQGWHAWVTSGTAGLDQNGNVTITRTMTFRGGTTGTPDGRIEDRSGIQPFDLFDFGIIDDGYYFGEKEFLISINNLEPASEQGSNADRWGMSTPRSITLKITEDDYAYRIEDVTAVAIESLVGQTIATLEVVNNDKDGSPAAGGLRAGWDFAFNLPVNWPTQMFEKGDGNTIKTLRNFNDSRISFDALYPNWTDDPTPLALPQVGTFEVEIIDEDGDVRSPRATVTLRLLPYNNNPLVFHWRPNVLNRPNNIEITGIPQGGEREFDLRDFHSIDLDRPEASNRMRILGFAQGNLSRTEVEQLKLDEVEEELLLLNSKDGAGATVRVIIPENEINIDDRSLFVYDHSTATANLDTYEPITQDNFWILVKDTAIYNVSPYIGKHHGAKDAEEVYDAGEHLVWIFVNVDLVPQAILPPTLNNVTRSFSIFQDGNRSWDGSRNADNEPVNIQLLGESVNNIVNPGRVIDLTKYIINPNDPSGRTHNWAVSLSQEQTTTSLGATVVGSNATTITYSLAGIDWALQTERTDRIRFTITSINPLNSEPHAPIETFIDVFIMPVNINLASASDLIFYGQAGEAITEDLLEVLVGDWVHDSPGINGDNPVGHWHLGNHYSIKSPNIEPLQLFDGSKFGGTLTWNIAGEGQRLQTRFTFTNSGNDNYGVYKFPYTIIDDFFPDPTPPASPPDNPDAFTHLKWEWFVDGKYSDSEDVLIARSQPQEGEPANVTINVRATNIHRPDISATSIALNENEDGGQTNISGRGRTTLTISDGDFYKNLLPETIALEEKEQLTVEIVSLANTVATDRITTGSAVLIGADTDGKFRLNNNGTVILAYAHGTAAGLGVDVETPFTDTVIVRVTDNSVRADNSREIRVPVIITPINDIAALGSNQVYSLNQNGTLIPAGGRLESVNIWSFIDPTQHDRDAGGAVTQNVVNTYSFVPHGYTFNGESTTDFFVTPLNTSTPFAQTFTFTPNENNGFGGAGIYVFTYAVRDEFATPAGANNYVFVGGKRFLNDVATPQAGEPGDEARRTITFNVMAQNSNTPTIAGAVIAIEENQIGTSILTIEDLDFAKNDLPEAVKLGRPGTPEEQLTVEIVNAGNPAIGIASLVVSNASGVSLIDGKAILDGNTTDSRTVTLQYAHGTAAGLGVEVETPFTDVITVRVTDSEDKWVETAITVNITPINDNAPVAMPNRVTINIGSTLTLNPIGDRGRLDLPDAGRQVNVPVTGVGIIDLRESDYDLDMWTDGFNLNLSRVGLAAHHRWADNLALVEASVLATNPTPVNLRNEAGAVIPGATVRVSRSGNNLAIHVPVGSAVHSGYFYYSVTDSIDAFDALPFVRRFEPNQAFTTNTGRIYVTFRANPADQNWAIAGGNPTLTVPEGGNTPLLSGRAAGNTVYSSAANTNLLWSVPVSTASGISADRVIFTRLPDPAVASVFATPVGEAERLIVAGDLRTGPNAGTFFTGTFRYEHVPGREENNNLPAFIGQRTFDFVAVLPAAFTIADAPVISAPATVTVNVTPRNNSAPNVADKVQAEDITRLANRGNEKTDILVTVIDAGDRDNDDWGGMVTDLQVAGFNVNGTLSTTFTIRRASGDDSITVRLDAGNTKRIIVNHVAELGTMGYKDITLNNIVIKDPTRINGDECTDLDLTLLGHPTTGEGLEVLARGSRVNSAHRINPVQMAAAVRVYGKNDNAPLLNYKALDQNTGNDDAMLPDRQPVIDTLVLYVGQRLREFDITMDGGSTSPWILINDEREAGTEVEHDRQIRTRTFRDFDYDGQNVLLDPAVTPTIVENIYGDNTGVIFGISNNRFVVSAGANPWEGIVTYTANDGNLCRGNIPGGEINVPVSHNVVGRVHVIIVEADANRPISLENGGILTLNEGAMSSELDNEHLPDTDFTTDRQNSLLSIVRIARSGDNPEQRTPNRIRITDVPNNGLLQLELSGVWTTVVQGETHIVRTGSAFVPFRYVHNNGAGYSVRETAESFEDSFEFIPILPNDIEGDPTPVNIEILPRNNQVPTLVVRRTGMDEQGGEAKANASDFATFQVIHQTTGTNREGFDYDNDIGTILRLPTNAEIQAFAGIDGITAEELAVRPLYWLRNGAERTWTPDSFKVVRNDYLNIDVTFLHEVGRNANDTIVVEFWVVDPTDYCPIGTITSTGNGAPNKINPVKNTIRIGITPKNNHAPTREETFIDSVFVSFAAREDITFGASVGVINAPNGLLQGLPTDLQSLPLSRVRPWIDGDGDPIEVYTIDSLRIFASQAGGLTRVGTNAHTNASSVNLLSSAISGDALSIALNIANVNFFEEDLYLIELENGQSFMGYVYDLHYTVRDLPFEPHYGGVTHPNNRGVLRIFIISQPAPNIGDITLPGDGWKLNKGAFNDGGGHGSFVFGGKDIKASRLPANSADTLASITQLFDNVDRMIITRLPENGTLYGRKVGVDGVVTEDVFVALTAADVSRKESEVWTIPTMICGLLRYEHIAVTGRAETLDDFADRFDFNVMLKQNFGSLLSDVDGRINIEINRRNSNVATLANSNEGTITEGQAELPITPLTPTERSSDIDIGTTVRISEATAITSELASEPGMSLTSSTDNTYVYTHATSGRVITIRRTGDNSITYRFVDPNMSWESSIEDRILVPVIDPTPYTLTTTETEIGAGWAPRDGSLNGEGARNILHLLWNTVDVTIRPNIRRPDISVLGSQDDTWSLNEGALSDIFAWGGEDISASKATAGEAAYALSIVEVVNNSVVFPGDNTNYIDRMVIKSLPTNGTLFGKKFITYNGDVAQFEPDFTEITEANTVICGQLRYKHNAPTDRAESSSDFVDAFTFTVMLKEKIANELDVKESDVGRVGIRITPRNNNPPRGQTFIMPALEQGAVGNFITVPDDNLSRGDPDIQTFARIPDVSHFAADTGIIMILNDAGDFVPVPIDSIRIVASTDGRSIEYEHLKPLFGQTDVTTRFVIQLVDSTSNTPIAYSDVINEDDDFELNSTGNRNKINVTWDTLHVTVNAKDCGGAIVLIDEAEDETKDDEIGGGCGFTRWAHLRVHAVEEGKSVDIDVNLVLGANTPADTNRYIVDGRILDIDGDILHFNVNVSPSGHSKHNMATVTKRNEMGGFTYTHRGTGVEEFTDTVHITISDLKGHLTNVYVPLVIIPRKDEGTGFRAKTVSVDEFATVKFDIRDSITTDDRWPWDGTKHFCDKDALTTGLINVASNAREYDSRDSVEITIHRRAGWTGTFGVCETSGNPTYEDDFRRVEVNNAGEVTYQIKGSAQEHLDFVWVYIEEVRTARYVDTVTVAIKAMNWCNPTNYSDITGNIFVNITNVKPIAVKDHEMLVNEGEPTIEFVVLDPKGNPNGTVLSYYRSVKDNMSTYDSTRISNLRVWLVDENIDRNGNPMPETTGAARWGSVTFTNIAGVPEDTSVAGRIRYEHNANTSWNYSFIEDGRMQHNDRDLFRFVISDGVSEDTATVTVFIRSGIPRLLEDVAPYFEDINADGTIDRITVAYSGSVPHEGLDFDVSFNGSPISITGVTSETILGTGSVETRTNVRIALNTDAALGNAMPANTTSGTMLLTTRYLDFHADGNPVTVGPVEVADGAAPVVVSAQFHQNTLGADTLSVVLSEYVDFNVTEQPFFVLQTGSGTVISPVLTEFRRNNDLDGRTTVRFTVAKDSVGRSIIAQGDSLFINHAADPTGVRDFAGLDTRFGRNDNVQRNENNVRREIVVGRFNSIVSAWYLEEKAPNIARDGYINRVRVETANQLTNTHILGQLANAITLPDNRLFTIDSVRAVTWGSGLGERHGFDIFVTQDRNALRTPNTAVDTTDVLILANRISAEADSLLYLLPTAPIRIIDGVAPIVLRGDLSINNRDTTLVIEFSEPVNINLGGSSYDFISHVERRVFNMHLPNAPTMVVNNDPRRWRYEVKGMDVAFPITDDSIRIVAGRNLVRDTQGNIQQRNTVYAPLFVTDTRAETFNLSDWIKIYPSPARLIKGANDALIPAPFNYYDNCPKGGAAAHYRVGSLFPGENGGVLIVLEAETLINKNPAAHSGRVRIFDQTGNAVTDVLEMKFYLPQTGVMTGVALWNLKNSAGRIVAPMSYLAIIEIDLVMEEGSDATPRRIQENRTVNVGLGAGAGR